MTEKRFCDKTDSEKINNTWYPPRLRWEMWFEEIEELTEKRFILTEQFSALQGVTFVKDECVDVDTWYTVDGAVDLLNTLLEENEELNEENRELRMVIDGLKQQNQKFKGRLNDLGVEYYD